MPVSIAPLSEGDRARWDPLWAGYLTFYETKLAPEVTDATWARLMDPMSPVCGLGAHANGTLIGFAHYVLHGGTWDVRPTCYLEDLYVDETVRGSGAGRALIEALADKGRAENWTQIYWQTASGNVQAQYLYDRLATRTDWVRYDLTL